MYVCVHVLKPGCVYVCASTKYFRLPPFFQHERKHFEHFELTYWALLSSAIYLCCPSSHLAVGNSLKIRVVHIIKMSFFCKELQPPVDNMLLSAQSVMNNGSFWLSAWHYFLYPLLLAVLLTRGILEKCSAAATETGQSTMFSLQTALFCASTCRRTGRSVGYKLTWIEGKHNKCSPGALRLLRPSSLASPDFYKAKQSTVSNFSRLVNLNTERDVDKNTLNASGWTHRAWQVRGHQAPEPLWHNGCFEGTQQPRKTWHNYFLSFGQKGTRWIVLFVTTGVWCLINLFWICKLQMSHE